MLTRRISQNARQGSSHRESSREKHSGFELSEGAKAACNPLFGEDRPSRAGRENERQVLPDRTMGDAPAEWTLLVTDWTSMVGDSSREFP